MISFGPWESLKSETFEVQSTAFGLLPFIPVQVNNHQQPEGCTLNLRVPLSL